MNSRDANFDIIIKETLAATAAEAEAAGIVTQDDAIDSKDDPEEDIEGGGGGGLVAGSGGGGGGGAGAGGGSSAASRKRRRTVPGPKRSSHSSRNRSSHAPRRPPASHAATSAVAQSLTDSRRNNPASGVVMSGTVVPPSSGGTGPPPSTTTYRASHAYAIAQQPLFTSWGLPDYLAHLEAMLPSNVPRPIEVPGGGFGVGGVGSGVSESGTERGVKVKWPSKRMSVGDMNKRVRALVEWVGREQAGAGDRGRRKDVLKGKVGAAPRRGGEEEDAQNSRMSVDPPVVAEKPVGETDGESAERPTMTIMEELMEELIGFQERFGPAVKARERERRVGTL
jgi:hypothetical protein